MLSEPIKFNRNFFISQLIRRDWKRYRQQPKCYKLFLNSMPWFESSKDKQFRELVEGKMEICLTKPDKYDQAFPVLDSLVRKPNQKAIEMIVNHIKQVIKEDEFEPAQKLRALILLRDLMASQSKPLGKYVVSKILKRLTILAQHRKNQKQQNRGANIFKCKKSQEKYGIEFLKILLLCLSDWGKNWPRHADGPFHDFQSAYNDLLLQKQVAFPPDEKKLSKSPAPKVNRNSREQLSSPPKKSPTPNEKIISNPLSKPVIKEKPPVSGAVAEYLNSMIEILGLLSSTLSENPEFGQIWGIIKAYVDQFKTVDEQGNLIVAQMVEAGDQNEQILQAIQTNSDFIAQLIKDTRTVENKNESYGKYNGKYVKKCKKLILSLSIFLQKPNSSSLTNNNASANLRPPGETSMNEKVQEVPQPEKPKAEQERNRYGSSNQLRKNLEIKFNPIKKQDFNSGTLSKHNENSESNRYNSVTGNQNQKNRFSASSQFQEMKQQEKQDMQNQDHTENGKLKEKSVDFFEAFDQKKESNKQTKKEISKISQRNENQSQINKFDFQNNPSKKEPNNQLFGEFEVSGEKKQNSNSNSNFFKELQNQKGKMPATKTRDRKPLKKNTQQVNNFFNVSVRSKVGQGISEFEKSKQSSKEVKENQPSNDNSNLKAFDTFKSPNEIVHAMNELKKGGDNQSQSSKRSAVSNPFEKSKNGNDNPFAFEFGQNSFNKSHISGKSQNNSNMPRGQRSENPFQTKYSERKQYVDDNPFATKIEDKITGFGKREDDDENKSKSSNPFSVKHPSEKSHEKSSIKSKPPIPRKKSDLNPFDTKSYHSKKNEENPQDQPNFNNSFVSNPFGDDQKKVRDSDKSLSQRGSFVNVRNAGSIKNPSNIIDNPFEMEENQKAPAEDKKEKSFQGFNFDDFMNVSGHKSESGSIRNKQVKNEKHNESGFHFSDFDEVRNSQKQKNQKSNSFSANNFFEQSNKLPEKKAPSQQNSFNFFQNMQNQNKSRGQNFFDTSKQAKKEKGNLSNFFQTSKEQNNAQKNGNGTNRVENPQIQFEDFQNISNTDSKPFKNQFFQFDKSKGSIESIKKQPKQKLSINMSGDSWSKIGKKSAQDDSEEWKKFANIAEKQSQESKSPKSERESQYEPSEAEQKQKGQLDLPWLNNNSEVKRKDYIVNREQNQYQANQPKFGNSEKSISIHFDEPSPFQKKQIPWQYTHAAIPSSTRYNIGPESIKEKREVLILLDSKHKASIENYNSINQKLNQIKKEYLMNSEKLVQLKEQKHEFLKILSRLKESNEVKQREIQDVIKKKIRAEALKTKILQKEKSLYEKMKNQRNYREQELANKERMGNKWERFNQNLKRQKEMAQIEKTVSHFSYYA